MKSIKPGRGPSAMGAAVSIFAIIFGLFWTIMAYCITQDAPFPLVGAIFPLFGILFVIIGIMQAIFHFKNATSKERMSLFDITHSREEADPLNRHFGTPNIDLNETSDAGSFCPYCGERVKSSYQFCRKCGKNLH